MIVFAFKVNFNKLNYITSKKKLIKVAEIDIKNLGNLIHLFRSGSHLFLLSHLPTEAISNLSQLDVLYTNGSITQKRKIISSIFPGKLAFDGFQYRTAKVNEAVTLSCLINSALKSKKNGTNSLFSNLSQEVIWLGLEPRAHTLKVYCSTN